MDCSDCQDNLVNYWRKVGNPTVRGQVERHVAECKHCAAELAELEEMEPIAQAWQLSEEIEEEEVSERLIQRIMAEARERQPTQAEPPPSPAPQRKAEESSSRAAQEIVLHPSQCSETLQHMGIPPPVRRFPLASSVRRHTIPLSFSLALIIALGYFSFFKRGVIESPHVPSVAVLYLANLARLS